jgi:hypothetical protein
MKAQGFRTLALEFPETLEGTHMDHPDFRVGGKIFATLGPGELWGMVKLTPDQQACFVKDEPQVFHPTSGAWGLRGATIVELRRARISSVWLALELAWCNTAPKKLLKELHLN